MPFLNAAAGLFVRGVADVETIDLIWRRSTARRWVPSRSTTWSVWRPPYHLARNNPNPEMQQFAEIVKRDYIDQGRLGVGVGKGSYDYT